MHLSNISGGLILSQGLRHVIKKCSNGTTGDSRQTKDRLQKLPPTPKKFRKMYPGAKSLPEIAKATRIPLRTVKTIYNRGLAAWRTGHRPGASPQAWGYARVHSFATKGKTYYTADKDLR